MKDIAKKLGYEKLELEEKIDRLSSFVDFQNSLSPDASGAIPEADFKLLCDQRDIMKQYAEILGKRIELILAR